MQPESLGYPVRGGYFMSQEQEDATHWQQFQTYKKFSSSYAALQGKMQQWGLVFEQLSSLAHLPYVSPHLRALISQLPNRDEMLAAVTEMDSLSQQMETLKGILQKAGMDFPK